jgi:hypothetical protein
MKSLAFTMRAPLLARVGAFLSFAALALALVLIANGCNQGAEGDRCNPDLAMGESDCGNGLTCTQPPDCPENYCCPKGPSANAFCQPGCAGGQASICDAGGDADCASLDGGDGG